MQCSRLAAVLLSLALGTHAWSGAPATPLGAAFAKLPVQVIGIEYVAPNPGRELKARSRHAGRLKIALRSSRVLKDEEVQTLAEDVRQAAELIGLPSVFSSVIYVFAQHVGVRDVTWPGETIGPFSPKSTRDASGAPLTLQTLVAEDLPLDRPATWYACSACFRSYVVDSRADNALVEVRDWGRLDMRCEANTTPPRPNVVITAKPEVVPAVAPVRAAAAPTRELVGSSDLKLANISLARRSPRSLEEGIWIASATALTSGRPADAKEVAAFATRVRDQFEELPIPLLGAVQTRVYEEYRLALGEDYSGLDFDDDRSGKKRVRFAVDPRKLPDGDAAVGWYGCWIWGRPIDAALTASGALLVRRPGPWDAYGWWSEKNALPPQDRAAIERHPPRLVEGRVPKPPGKAR